AQPPPASPLFPYTTLFRSRRRSSERLPPAQLPAREVDMTRHERSPAPDAPARSYPEVPPPGGKGGGGAATRAAGRGGRATPTHRSEEHTSELQSRENLVCR